VTPARHCLFPARTVHVTVIECSRHILVRPADSGQLCNKRAFRGGKTTVTTLRLVHSYSKTFRAYHVLSACRPRMMTPGIDARIAIQWKKTVCRPLPVIDDGQFIDGTVRRTSGIARATAPRAARSGMDGPTDRTVVRIAALRLNGGRSFIHIASVVIR